MSRNIQIGIIGGREESSAILDLAEEAGKKIAEKGATLICGGMSGVMEAACKGARSAGGVTVGILPTGSGDDANPYVDIVLPTNLGVARNAVIIQSCDGVIAVGGSFGTLSEMAFACQLGKPLVSLKSWCFDKSIPLFEKAEDAVEAVFELIREANAGTMK